MNDDLDKHGQGDTWAAGAEGVYDLVVVGAGISGLCFAHFARHAGFSTLVLEKSAEVGGLIESITVDEEDGFCLEMGAHTCYNSYSTLLEVLDECGGLDLLQSRLKLPYRFWHRQRICSIASRLHFLELLFSIWRLPFTDKDDLNLKEFYSHVLGEDNYRDVFHHAFSAVLSQNADGYPAAMLFKKRPHHRNSVMRKFSARGGLQSIPRAISKTLNIKHQVKVKDIFAENGYIVATSQGEIRTKHIAIATDHKQASSLLRHVNPDVAELLSMIPTAYIETVAVALKKEHCPLEPHAGLISTDTNFYSSVSRDVIADKYYRGMTYHYPAKQLGQTSKLSVICESLNVMPENILFSEEKSQSLPAPMHGHDLIIDKIHSRLQNTSCYLVGNYFNGIAIEDCVVRAKQESSRLKSNPNGK